MNPFVVDNVFLFFKGAFLVIIALYTIFLLIVFKQIHSMNKMVRQEGSFVLEFLSVLLVLATISLFFVTLAIL